MALELYWYDFICFAIMSVAIAGSLWTILQKEGRRRPWTEHRYKSLLIVADAAASKPNLVALSRTGHVGSAQLWMSCWQCVHPGWLLVLRIVALGTMVGFLSWDIYTHGTRILLYYTEWTFTLVIIYFVIGTVISAHGCWVYSKQDVTEDEEANGFLKSFEESGHANLTYRANNAIRLQDHNVKEVNEKRAGLWGYVMQTVYQTSAGAVMLTDIVFWGLLVPFMTSDHFTVNVIMSCMHSLNAVFLLGDTALNSMPFPWFRMAYFVLLSCIYVIFQWVLHACGFTWWPYPFLELSTPWAPVWYIAMAVVHIPCYLLYWLIVKAKKSFFPKWFPHAYTRSC